MCTSMLGFPWTVVCARRALVVVAAGALLSAARGTVKYIGQLICGGYIRILTVDCKHNFCGTTRKVLLGVGIGTAGGVRRHFGEARV